MALLEQNLAGQNVANNKKFIFNLLKKAPACKNNESNQQ